MILSIIAAIGKNHEIGYENDLLWHISADLKRFKQITSGHALIMGRRTFESIGSRPLPKRRNIIVSRNPNQLHEKVEMAQTIEQAMALVSDEEEVFILGGAVIYKEMLPFTQRMYLTHVHANYKADTFFPSFDLSDWEITQKTDICDDAEAGVDYSFISYHRK